VPVGDDMPDDHFVKVGHEAGMRHPLGAADGFGTMTPWLNLNKSAALTWCFVIGREGGVRWAGNPARDDEEFLAAVSRALREDLPPLAGPVPEELAEAVAEYVGGDLTRARTSAEKALGRLDKKKGDVETEARAVQARALLATIDAWLAARRGGLASAVANDDAETFARERRRVLAHFPKSDAVKELKTLEKGLREHGDLGARVAAWTEWLELEDERPPTFPARRDKDGERYAKKLRKRLEGGDAELPGRARCEGWLTAFDAVVASE